MQEPVHPHPPYKGEYESHVDQKFIYLFKEELRHYEDDRDDDDYDEEVDPTEEAKYSKVPPNETTLAQLLERLPEGITPEQVKIDLT